MSSLSRRAWFKSVGGATAGVMATSFMAQTLMAAPVSKAEEHFFTKEKKSGKKIRLNSNENPYGPSDKARKAVNDVLSEGNRYAFNELQELKKLLAAKEGVEPEYILLGSGSGELLVQTGIAYGLQGGRVLSCYPTFTLLMNYAQQMNAVWDKVDLNEKLEYDFDALAAAIKPDTRLVFVCNPNNPTGTVVNADTVKSFCTEASGKTLVYADEAYLEFLEPAEQKSMVSLVSSSPNVVVSRTFSKIYGLAGLRMGYLVAHPDTLKKIARYGDSISPSQTAVAAAKASLGDEEFMKMTREKNAAARKVLTDYLDRKKVFYGKSRNNVVFFPAPNDEKTMLSELDQKVSLMRVWEYEK